MRFDTSVWQRALTEKKKQNEALRSSLLHKAVPLLKQYFVDKEVAAVFLCGSILKPYAFDQDSDIDIAAAGLKENVLRVAADLEALLDWEIDLIELENCHFRDQIEEEGMRVL
ncbi:nucleotidyltransferase family protein [Dethiobacter alkaliphilus]|uniref:nucleotidyltransferase family protein n=1 Tax=Dethiobacter alkaliphilus TaxID=427926 RepID=UPI0022278176|nr:nucleotidyltransferase domain-containing protein [Dethiobacter alkaliphilus]MCW3491148.1 nucleotidyltransferase domain-containing protein [Dethiobacter alkaliphilus]